MSASYRPKKYETAVREGESRLDCIALLDELSKNLKIQGKRMTFPSNIPGSTTLQAEVYSGAMWIGCIDTTERRFENERPSHYDFKIWAENKVSLAYLIDFLNDTPNNILTIYSNKESSLEKNSAHIRQRGTA